MQCCVPCFVKLYVIVNNIKILNVVLKMQQCIPFGLFSHMLLPWHDNRLPLYFCQTTKYVMLSIIHVKCRYFCPILAFRVYHHIIINLKFKDNPSSASHAYSLTAGVDSEAWRSYLVFFTSMGMLQQTVFRPVTPSPGTSTCTRGLSAIHMQ
jgi:hypothetical protein